MGNGLSRGGCVRALFWWDRRETGILFLIGKVKGFIPAMRHDGTHMLDVWIGK